MHINSVDEIFDICCIGVNDVLEFFGLLKEFRVLALHIMLALYKCGIIGLKLIGLSRFVAEVRYTLVNFAL